MALNDGIALDYLSQVYDRPIYPTHQTISIIITKSFAAILLHSIIIKSASLKCIRSPSFYFSRETTFNRKETSPSLRAHDIQSLKFIKRIASRRYVLYYKTYCLVQPFPVASCARLSTDKVSPLLDETTISRCSRP